MRRRRRDVLLIYPSIRTEEGNNIKTYSAMGEVWQLVHEDDGWAGAEASDEAEFEHSELHLYRIGCSK